MLKDASPFTPGRPVGVDLFAGRERQLNQAAQFVRFAASGRQENMFLIGDRGIGKSSFASVVCEHALRDCGMIGVQVNLGGASTLEELVRRVVQDIMQAGKGEAWYQRVFQTLGDRIREVGVLSLKVSFQPPESDLTAIAERFPDVLGELLSTIMEDNRKGLVIVLDDINGLAETPMFARWYKSMVDSIAIQFKSYPVLIMVSGIPAKRNQLSRHEPSLMRIFRIITLDRLRNDEVNEFFHSAFAQADMHVDDDALQIMTQYASGLPVMMQEIGEAVFLTASNRRVTPSDAIRGILGAADNVGQKYLEPSVLAALQSPRYHSIFRKIGESIDPTFRRSEIRARLDDAEERVFDNLLRRLRQLEVIEQVPEWGRGTYRYTNQIYPVYMYMQSLSQKD